MFANTLDAVEELGLTYLHVFPYSPRPGTPAARMPQVPGPVRRERAARLRDAGDAGARPLLRRPRRHDARRCWWRQPRHRPLPVVCAGCSRLSPAEPGTLVPVRINAADDERLYAEMAS